MKRFCRRRRSAMPRTVATLLLLTLPAAAAIVAPRAASASEGTITQIGTAPNYYWDHRSAVQGTGTDPAALSRATTSFVDSQNGVLFEFNNLAGCSSASLPNLVAMDVDSYQVVATDLRKGASPCRTEDAGGGTGTFNVPAPNGASPPPTVVVDPQDKILVGALQDNTNGMPLVVLDESTLKFVAQWTLPTAIATRHIYGLSWYAPENELIVLSSNGNTAQQTVPPVPPGVTVSAYKVSDALRMGTGTLTALWSQNVSQCEYSLVPIYGTASAYRSVRAPAEGTGVGTVFVPCQLFSESVAGAGVTRVGVVALQLGDVDPVTGSACDACPDGTVDTEVAPGIANDFFFDPGGDRGFMPQQGANEMSAMVYDGSGGVGGRVQPSFLGKTSLGAGTTALIGLDQSTGRIYSVTDHGMTLIDGRRTPVSPGVFRSDLAQPVVAGSTAILPPDGRYPFTRVLLSDLTNYTGPNTGEERDLKVLDDGYAVTQDPPASNVDSNTVSGPVPPGAAVNTIVNGTARGYGFHMDVVAGLQGTINNIYQTFQVSGVPLGHGYRDLLGGSIDHVSLSSTGTSGQASALADGNGGVSFDVSQCTNTNALGNCAPPPQPPCNVLTPHGLPCPSSPSLPSAPSGGANTTQPWPFPDALCTLPGSAPSGDSNGFYSNTDVTPAATPSAGATPTPTPGPIPGSDSANAANAHVNCLGEGKYFPGGVYGASHLRGPSSDGVVTIASASSTSGVYPRTDIQAIQSETTSEASGVDIKLGGQELQIGDVLHTVTARAGGTTGSASATNSISLKNVFINHQEICSGQCDPQAVAKQIDANFPFLLQVLYPVAAAPFGLDGSGNPKGSPGGYEGIVQASPTEMYGDEQFNGMSPEEASLLPAMRIVIYGYNDGNPNQSRLIVDLAGTENDAQVGRQVLTALPPEVDVNTSVIDTNAAAAAAGVFGDDGTTGNGGTGGGQQAGGAGSDDAPPGLAGLAVRAFHGLLWLVRSPADGVRMAAFLALLATPIVLMRRRWTWMDKPRRGE